MWLSGSIGVPGTHGGLCGLLGHGLELGTVHTEGHCLCMASALLQTVGIADRRLAVLPASPNGQSTGQS